MRAEFLRPPPQPPQAQQAAETRPDDDARPEEVPSVVGAATWTGREVEIEPAAEEGAEAAIRRVFRPEPVLVDDPSLRSPGSSGPTLLEPGDLRWFLAVARVRA